MIETVKRETVCLSATSTEGQNHTCNHWNGTEYSGLLQCLFLSKVKANI